MADRNESSAASQGRRFVTYDEGEVIVYVMYAFALFAVMCAARLWPR